MKSCKRTKVLLSLLSAITFLSAIMPLPSIANAQGSDLVLYDGEAENSLDGCSSWIQKEDGSGSFSIDTTVTHDGKQSLKLSATAENIVDVNYWFGEKTVPANSTVKLSGYVKTENLTVTGAGLRVLYGTIGLEYALGVTGTNDWTAFETTVTGAEEKALSGTNMCFDMNGCVGTAWFQGVKLEIVEEPEQPKNPNVLYDGEAENSLDGCSSWIQKEDGSGSFSIDTTVTHDGKQSLKLSATAENIVDVNYWFGEKTVPANSTVKLSGYVKTENLTVTGAGLRVLYGTIGLEYALGVTGTNDWAAFETTVTVAEEKALSGTNMCFDMNGCVGTAWLQGVKLEIVEEPEQPENSNVLYDGEAENSLDGCSSWIQKEDGSGSFSIDTTVTHDGKQSLKLSATAENIVDVNYWFGEKTVPANSTVKLSGYVKTENLTVTGAGLRVLYGTIGLEYALGVTGTNDWTAFETTVTVAEEKALSGTNMCFDMNGCVGTAWLQGVKLEIVTAPEQPEEPEQPKNPNVLYDGEAEISLDGCSSWMLNEDGSGSFGIDTTVTHDGKQSLKLSATAENIVDVNYWFGEKTVPAGAVIKLSGYAKTENLTVTGAGLRVLYNAIGLTCSINLTGTNDWTAFETTVTVAEETVLTTTNLCFDINGCVGTAWFQGVKLEIVDIVELTNVLYDAGAESADTFGNYRTWQTSNDAGVSLDTTVTREGKPSIQFKATASSIADLYIPLNVTVVKGKSIKVSGWIKTDNLETTSEGMRFVLQKKVGENDSEAMSFGNVKGTSDWTYFEKIYTPTEDTMISQLILNMNWCTGTAWVQGVKVEMVDEEEPPEDPSDVPYLPPEDDDDDIFDAPSNIDDSTNNKEENQSPGTGMSTMFPISLLAICSAAGIVALRKKQK